jgi:hypothetical protein
VVGGGFDVPDERRSEIVVTESKPSDDSDGWIAEFTLTRPSQTPVGTIYAVCAE